MLKQLASWVGIALASSAITLFTNTVNIESEKIYAAKHAVQLCEAQLAINKVYTCDGKCQDEQIARANKARAAYIKYMYAQGEWSGR